MHNLMRRLYLYPDTQLNRGSIRFTRVHHNHIRVTLMHSCSFVTCKTGTMDKNMINMHRCSDLHPAYFPCQTLKSVNRINCVCLSCTESGREHNPIWLLFEMEMKSFLRSTAGIVWTPWNIHLPTPLQSSTWHCKIKMLIRASGRRDERKRWFSSLSQRLGEHSSHRGCRRLLNGGELSAHASCSVKPADHKILGKRAVVS